MNSITKVTGIKTLHFMIKNMVYEICCIKTKLYAINSAKLYKYVTKYDSDKLNYYFSQMSHSYTNS